MRRRHVGALAYATATATYLFNTEPVLIGLLAREFGFTADRLGYVAGAAALATFLVFAAGPFWVQRVPVRRVVAVGAALLLATLMPLFWVRAFPALVILFFGAGLGGALVYVVALAALGATPNPTRAFGIAISLQVLLAGVMMLVIPGWLYSAAGWRGVVLAYLSPALLMLARLPWIPARQADVAPAVTGAPPRARRGAVWIALAATTVYFAGINGIWTFAERIGAAFALEGGVIGAVIGLALIGSVAGSAAASVVKVGFRTAMGLVFAGFVLVTGLLWVGSGAILFAASMLLLNVFWNFSLPSQWSLVATLGGPRSVALIPAAMALGCALGAAAAGHLSLWGGYPALYAWLLVLTALALAAFARAAREVKGAS